MAGPEERSHQFPHWRVKYWLNSVSRQQHAGSPKGLNAKGLNVKVVFWGASSVVAQGTTLGKKGKTRAREVVIAVFAITPQGFPR